MNARLCAITDCAKCSFLNKGYTSGGAGGYHKQGPTCGKSGLALTVIVDSYDHGLNAIKYPIPDECPLAEPGRLEGLLKRMVEELKEADAVICSLCKRLNPQHADCTSCQDREGRLRILADAAKEVCP